MLEAIRAEAAKKADDVQAAISRQQATAARTKAPPTSATVTTPPPPPPPPPPPSAAPQQQQAPTTKPTAAPQATTGSNGNNAAGDGGRHAMAPTPVVPSTPTKAPTTAPTTAPTIVAAGGTKPSTPPPPPPPPRGPFDAPVSPFLSKAPLTPKAPSNAASGKEPGSDLSVSEKQAAAMLEGVRWHSPLQPFDETLSDVIPRRIMEHFPTSAFKPELHVICDTQAAKPIVRTSVVSDSARRGSFMSQLVEICSRARVCVCVCERAPCRHVIRTSMSTEPT